MFIGHRQDVISASIPSVTLHNIRKNNLVKDDTHLATDSRDLDCGLEEAET